MLYIVDQVSYQYQQNKQLPLRSHIISLNMNQEFYQYQQNKQLPLTSYHWTWIKNSTNINKTNNYLSHHITEHESRILPISTKQTTTSHIISLNMNQEFYQYQQNKQLPLRSHIISLNMNQEFYQYQQNKQLPLTTISLNMNQEFYQYQFNLIIVPGETD